MIEIRFDDAKLKQLEKELKGIPRALPKVMSRSLNRTASSARTDITDSIYKKTKIKKKYIRRGLKQIRATYRNWRSAVLGKYYAVPLISMWARQTKKGVTYRKIGAKNRILIRHAFIAKMQSGHKGVFKRRLKSRLPIDELYGPSLTHQWFESNRDKVKAIIDESRSKLAQSVHDQVQLILKRRLPA